MKTLAKKQQGFTLIELLVVIGILAILMAITLIAINPSKHFKDARNAQRQSDVVSVLDAIYEYTAANRGNLPPSVSSLPNSTAVPLEGISFPISASSTSFSSPNLTFNVPSGNIISGNAGTVTITGCSQAGDNGTFNLFSGTNTTIVVNDVGGSAVSATGCSITAWTGYANVCSDLVTAYLAALPMDPSSGTGTQCTSPYNSGYTITLSTNNRFTVAAPSAENSATISVTR